AAHDRAPARADDAGADYAWRAAGGQDLDAPQLAREVGAEARLHLGVGEAHPPAVVRGDLVEGVADAAQVGQGGRPDMLGVLRAPAGAREEVGPDRLAAVLDHLALGPLD